MTPSDKHASNRIFGSLGLVMGGKAGAGLVSLGYLVIAAPYLGPTDFGVLVLVHGYAVLVVGIFGFSPWQALVRYGAAAQHAGELGRLARLLRFGAGFEFAFGLLALTIAALMAPFAGSVLGWSPAATAIAVPYSVAVLASVRATPASYLQLIGRFDLIALHNLVAPTVRLAGAGIVAWFDLGLIGFLIAWMVAAIAEWATMWAMGLWLAAARLGPVLMRPGAGRIVAENPGIWRFTITNNVDITLRDLAERAAPLIVGWIMGPAAAGLFSVAQRATVILTQPALMLGTTSYAELARIVVDAKGGDLLRLTLVRVIGLSLCVAVPVVALLALFSESVVRLLAGSAYLASADVMIWLLAARAIALVTPPCSSALTAMGRPDAPLRINLVSSLIFLSILPLLLWEYGLIGAGIQAVGQAAFVAVAMAATTERISRRFRT